MRAKLYLHDDYLKYNGTDTEKEVVAKLASFVRDLGYICENKEENGIFVSSDFYGVEIYPGKNIYDLAEKLEREEKGIFYAVFANTASFESDMNLQVIREAMKYKESETECSSLLIFNASFPKDEEKADILDDNQKRTLSNKPYMTFDEYCIVYGKSSWVTLRRQILGNHPGKGEDFMKQCRQYFDNLTFSEVCVQRIEPYLDEIPRKIVYYLSCLNDCFFDFRKQYPHSDMNQLLEGFSGKYLLDTAGSLQRTSVKKESYTFPFKSKSVAGVVNVCCDPHLKIQHADSNRLSDNNGKVRYRIYFCVRDERVHPTNLLIGLIGPHI